MRFTSCKVDNQGRITLPVEWRKAQNVKADSEVLVTADANRLLVQTRAQSLTEAQQIVAKYARPERSAVEQLLSERRQEAQQEQEDADRHAKSV